MAELLLELFSEEIPAGMQAPAAENLRRLVTERLTAASLSYSDARAYATPRRLTLVVEGLPANQPDATEEKRGPRRDAPEEAIQGFLKGAGLSSIENAELRETEKGAFYFAVRHLKGRRTSDILPPLIAKAINDLRWPKAMRWAETIVTWVRPLHSILAILDGKVLNQEFGLGLRRASRGGGSLDEAIKINFGNTTQGHRIHAPEPFVVANFEDYFEKLAQAYVVLDAAKRRAMINSDAEAIAAAEGLQLVRDERLLDELAGLVEWPVMLLGRMDERFLALPREVLIAAMRTHQRYLALNRDDGSLAPAFIAVANLEAADGGASIIAGNQRVLTARLADAEYFWQTDLKRRLEDRLPALDDMVFHASLGSLGDKSKRITALAGEVAAYVPGAEADHCRAAAMLAKADLTTGMVGEFPELQGLMGSYYAAAQGERPEVAAAIAEHYAPQGPSDQCPTAPTSVAVALADKLDTLVGFFAIGETPTGSRDPFALRRAALGVIRIVLENALRVPLRPAFEAALAQIRKTISEQRRRTRQTGAIASTTRTAPGWDEPIDTVVLDLLDFFADRLKVHLREKGVRHDLIAAVFALGGEDDLVRLMARVEALTKFLAGDDGGNLLTAYRRAANIVRIEEKRDGREYRDVVRNLFSQPEEDELWQNLHAVQNSVLYSLEHEKFETAMEMMASLRPYVDKFFDEVTVNAEQPEIRANRLALLRAIVVVMDQVADFGQIEG